MPRMAAKGCVIYNPNAGSADRVEELKPLLREMDFLRTSSAEQTVALAADVARRGCEIVVAAGGDGTVHQVLNGIMTRRRRPILGILPLGTGNDLARTLAIPRDDAAGMARILRKAVPRTIDLIRIEMNRRRIWGINAAAGGFTGQVDEVMNEKLKKTWGPLGYVRAATKVMPDLRRYRTLIGFDRARPRQLNVLNVIVANGRTAGGGLAVASPANPEDGLLDVVIVHAGSMLEMAGVAARVLAGDYLNSDLVTHRRARRVTIESHPGMWFNVDGELIGNEPARFTIAPAALQVITGPTYRASIPPK